MLNQMNTRELPIKLSRVSMVFIFLVAAGTPASAAHERVTGRAGAQQLLPERAIFAGDEAANVDSTEEAVIHQAVDALKDHFQTRRELAEALFPDIKQRSEASEAFFETLKPRIEALSELVPPAASLSADRDALEIVLDDLKKDMKKLERGFRLAEESFERLLEAQVLLKRIHTPGQLERVRELLRTTRTAFDRTNGMPTLSGRMEAVEAGIDVISQEASALFLNFSREVEQDLENFITGRPNAIQVLERRIAQLDEMPGTSKAIKRLLVEGEALIRDLQASFEPVQAALLGIKANSRVVERGILFSPTMMADLEEARNLVKDLLDRLSVLMRELDQMIPEGEDGSTGVNSSVGTQTATRTPAFTHFSIVALRYLNEDIRAREEIRRRLEESEPGIFGVNEFVTFPVPVTEEEARAREAEEETQRKREKLLLVREVTTPREQDVGAIHELPLLDRERGDILIQVRGEPPLAVETPVPAT